MRGNWDNFYEQKLNPSAIRKTASWEWLPDEGVWLLTLAKGSAEFSLRLTPDDARSLGYALEEWSWDPPQRARTL